MGPTLRDAVCTPIRGDDTSNSGRFHTTGEQSWVFRSGVCIAAATAVALAVLCFGFLDAYAESDAISVVVCSGGTGSVETLAASIETANANAGPDTIVILSTDGNVCTFEFTTARAANQALPMITESLTITGAQSNMRRANGAPEMRLFRTITNTAALTLANMAIQKFVAPSNSPNGGAIYARGDLTLDRMGFYENRAHSGNGGAVRVLGNAYVTAGDFEGNEAGKQGGALAVIGSLVITDNTLVSWNSAAQGGAVHASIVDLNGSYFKYNQSTEEGGAIYLAGSQATISDVDFVSNRSAKDGGAIWTPEGDVPVQIYGSYFHDNQAANYGGAIDGATIALTNTLFYSNAASYGGGIYADDKVVASGGIFISNTAVLVGGGLMAGSAEMSDSLFEYNRAGSIASDSGGGGAMLLYKESSILREVQFKGNEAAGDLSFGGAIQAIVPSLRIEHGTFIDNRVGMTGGAQGRGGAIHTQASLDLKRSRFDRNFADEGASLYLEYVSPNQSDVVNNLFVSSEELESANAIVVGPFVDLASARLSMEEPGWRSPTQADVGSSTTDDSEPVRFYHNTIIGYGHVGISVREGNAAVRNNILTGFTTGIEASASGIVIASHNLYHNVSQAELNVSESTGNLFQVDPLFVDANSGDYHLQDLSPAIDAGDDLDVLSDLENTVRPAGNGYDLGAFENPTASAMQHIYLPLVIRQ